MVDRFFAATKAFIVSDGKVLILRESADYDDGTNEGRYDVPGGRVEPGQRFDESLRREIREETGLEIDIGRPFHIDEWRPHVHDEDWQVVGTYILCVPHKTEVTLGPDHDDFQWISPADHKEYPMTSGLRKGFEQYLLLEER